MWDAAQVSARVTKCKWKTSIRAAIRQGCAVTFLMGGCEGWRDLFKWKPSPLCHSVADRCCAWAANQTMKPTKWLIIARSFLCDEAIGNGYWQCVSCLVLSYTYAHMYTHKDLWTPTTCTTCRVWACISCQWPSQIAPLLLLFCNAKQSASGHRTHLLILPENQPLLMQLGIRDLRSQIHEPWCFDQQQCIEKVEPWVVSSEAMRVFYPGDNAPRNKYGFFLRRCPSCIILQLPHQKCERHCVKHELALPVQHNPSSCHAALHPCIHHIL